MAHQHRRHTQRGFTLIELSIVLVIIGLLLGGVLGSLLPDFGPWPLFGGVLGISLLLAVSYSHSVRSSGNLSATSAVALLLTLALGILLAGCETTTACTAARGGCGRLGCGVRLSGVCCYQFVENDPETPVLNWA